MSLFSNVSNRIYNAKDVCMFSSTKILFAFFSLMLISKYINYMMFVSAFCFTLCVVSILYLNGYSVHILTLERNKFVRKKGQIISKDVLPPFNFQVK